MKLIVIVSIVLLQLVSGQIFQDPDFNLANTTAVTNNLTSNTGNKLNQIITTPQLLLPQIIVRANVIFIKTLASMAAVVILIALRYSISLNL